MVSTTREDDCRAWTIQLTANSASEFLQWTERSSRRRPSWLDPVERGRGLWGFGFGRMHAIAARLSFR